MLLSTIEIFTFKFLSKFYFYLWPFAITWNKDYTALYLSQYTSLQKWFYYTWVVVTFTYCLGGLCVVLFYNKYVGKLIIPWTTATMITSVVIVLPVVWVVINILKILTGALNQIIRLLINFKKGKNNPPFK